MVLDDSPAFCEFPNLEVVGRCDRCKTGGKACAEDEDGALGGGGGLEEEEEEGFSTIFPTSIF